MQRWLFLCLSVLGLAAADRWLKWLALSGRTYTFYIGQFFLVKNDALVFSWPAPNSVGIALMCLAIFAVIVYSWRIRKNPQTRTWLGLTFILFGALSNLYDRIVFGYVVDWGYLGRWWPVFNLADVIIAVGVVCLLFRQQKNTIDKTK